MSKNLKIGLFGFGCVGRGLYDIIEKTAFEAELVKICVKDRNKKRPIPLDYFTFEKKELLENQDINLIVELIDDADEAFEIVKAAMESGKNVVTANKKMVAEHLEELVELQRKYHASFLYEAAVCGSIPIIRNLAEYYDNELLHSVSGIFNGSSNYILTKVIEEDLAYEEAVKQAQDLGFAETDPTLDVGGFDPKYKLCLVVAQAYGVFIPPEEILNYGIQTLSKHDIQFAQEKNYKIKLLSHVEKVNDKTITAFVMPHFIPRGHYLYHVDNEYNAVIVEAAFSDKQVFVGKGAGGHPTGSAVLSDVSANRYNYQYEYRKTEKGKNLNYSTDFSMKVYIRYYDEKDLQGIDFQNVTEKYQGAEFSYIIASIKLENLISLRESLKERNIFIVNMD